MAVLCGVARTRRLVGLLTLLVLIAIVIGVTGVELPMPRFGGSAAQASLYQGVKQTGSELLLQAPSGGELAFLAVEPNGNLVVSDAGRASVLRFDSSGQLLSEWGPRLAGTQLGEPAGVAVSGNSYYVLDRGSPRIFKLDNTGQPQAVLDLQTLSTYGLNGLAVDGNGNLFAADTGRNRILVFSPTGQLLQQLGHGGSDLGAFTQPMALGFAADNSFFVADWENGRIERFAPTFEATDAWSLGFRSFGVAVDRTGRVYAADPEHRRVEAFTPQGAPLGELSADIAPKQIAIAPGGSLYALSADEIERLDFADTPPPPQTTAGTSDLLSIGALVLMLGLVVVAVLSRRSRREKSLLSTLDGPVRLHAKNGAQRQQQQPGADEDLLIANKPKGE